MNRVEAEKAARDGTLVTAIVNSRVYLGRVSRREEIPGGRAWFEGSAVPGSERFTGLISVESLRFATVGEKR